MEEYARRLDVSSRQEGFFAKLTSILPRRRRGDVQHLWHHCTSVLGRVTFERQFQLRRRVRLSRTRSESLVLSLCGVLCESFGSPLCHNRFAGIHQARASSLLFRIASLALGSRSGGGRCRGLWAVEGGRIGRRFGEGLIAW